MVPQNLPIRWHAAEFSLSSYPGQQSSAYHIAKIITTDDNSW